MRLVIYGDFNCPFSALASLRAARLTNAGFAEVDWRAVAHDLEIPESGASVGIADAKAYAAEIAQVHGLLLADETLELRLPVIRSNTVAATDAYAATEPGSRAQARIELFGAYWEEGRNLSDPSVLAALGLPSRAPELAGKWREEWLAFDRPLVPMMRLPDGHVSRGLGALARLGAMIAETPT